MFCNKSSEFDAANQTQFLVIFPGITFNSLSQIAQTGGYFPNYLLLK